MKAQKVNTVRRIIAIETVDMEIVLFLFMHRKQWNVKEYLPMNDHDIRAFNSVWRSITE